MQNFIKNLELMKRAEFKSKRTLLLDKAIEYVSNKYSVDKKNLYVAGGCTLDIAYDLDFYDIDMYVHVDDIDVTNIPHTAMSDMYAVLPHVVDGVDVDLIITMCPAPKKLSLFDIDVKTIAYNDGSFHVHDKVISNVKNKTFNIFANVDWSIFRYTRTATKYGLSTDSNIIYLLNNYLLYKLKEGKTVYMSEKYKSMWEEYKPYLSSIEGGFNYNKRLAMKTGKIIKHNKYVPNHRISLSRLYKEIKEVTVC